jgi:DNA polymerase IV
MVLESSPPQSSTFSSSTSPSLKRLPKTLDLSKLPAIYVLPTHLTADTLHDIEDQLEALGAPLTYDITEAKLVIGKVGTKKRAELELRTRKLWTEEVQAVPEENITSNEQGPLRKRARLESPEAKGKAVTAFEDGSSTESEGESQLSIRSRKLPEGRIKSKNAIVSQAGDGSDTESEEVSQTKTQPTPNNEIPRTPSPLLPKFSISSLEFSRSVRVLRLEWFQDSVKAGEILPLETYLVYEGRRTSRPSVPSTPVLSHTTLPKSPSKISPKSQQILADKPHIDSILERAKADASAKSNSQQAYYASAPHGIRNFRNPGTSPKLYHGTVQHQGYHHKRAKLLQMSTSEYDGSDSDIPPPPEWVKNGLLYSCQRRTLANPPNDAFITELKKIKLARLLTGDQIGVRAYSTSVASLAAYSHLISNAKEILRLPGCDIKIANLWIEWKNTGIIVAAEEAVNDDTFKTLKLFWEIWGVGDKTAREFYFDKGWRDLDDIIEYGWNDLSRVQQIGVKYYDEFQLGIPRLEVESIAAKVKEHAIKVRDDGIEILVVGGYRRGKEESGDVDIIVSHRDLDKTINLVSDIVASLEVEEWVTHTLLLHLTGSHRGQSTLPFKSVGVASYGNGFDTLDKALVVWQNPIWPTKSADLAANPKAKNPNVHRRVDIIISPWRTIGCAVMGWSGGTTFQRDLRRYVRKVHGWKFDSSGVRDRANGEVVALEGENGVDGSMVDAEKAVFEGMGLVYREPWERCTG